MFERLLFPRIETRIMVGITMFVAITILVGWIAINETARMQTFTQQELARSIENGATLFTNNCTRCHGPDGRGLSGLGPGLNNPQLFGYDFLGDVNKQIDTLTAQQTSLQDEQTKLSKELIDPATTADRKAEINKRLAEISTDLSVSSPDSVSSKLAAAQAQRDSLITAMSGAIDKGYDPTRPSRLKNVNWGGSTYSFIFTTLVAGRPVSVSYRGNNAMPAWSQTAGGPLRDDQLQDIANYILQWDKGTAWTVEDLLAVNQFAVEPAEFGGPSVPTVGTDVSKIVVDLATVKGDSARGDQLYHGSQRTGTNAKLNCSTCHEGGASAPPTAGTWARVQNDRLGLAQFAGYTGEQYLAESIVKPSAFVVPGYSDNVMPQDWGTKLTTQDLADVIAYLKTR